MQPDGQLDFAHSDRKRHSQTLTDKYDAHYIVAYITCSSQVELKFPSPFCFCVAHIFIKCNIKCNNGWLGKLFTISGEANRGALRPVMVCGVQTGVAALVLDGDRLDGELTD